MSEKEDRNRNFLRRFWRSVRRSYALAVFDRQTFKEKGAMSFTPLSIFLVGLGVFLFSFILVLSIVSFSPLKRYLPGIPGEGMEERSIQAISKADSLERELDLMKEHFSRIRAVFGGDTVRGELPLDSVKGHAPPEREGGMDGGGRVDMGPPPFHRYFYPPLRGAVTDAFNPSEDHFGVDLTTSKGEAIKAVLEGTVTFSSWTPQQGNVIQLQHPNGLMSVYKHNSVLLKETGQRVRTGDPIAIIGNTGELTTGPHLHFELWYKGDPIDPQEVLVF